MALESIKNINVDFYDNRYILINAKQYDDSSRWISVTCYNQGSIFNLSSSKHTAYIRYRKADGHTVFNFCTINTRGQILIELTEQMLAASGICDADLVIVNKGNAIVDVNTGEIIVVDNSAIISTMVFRVNVYEASVDNSLVESSDEFNLLNSKLKDYWADFENVVKTAKSWAVGGTGIDGRSEIEDVDNAKYYSQLSKSYAIGDANDIRSNEDTDNAKYYSEQSSDSADKSESYAVGGTGTRDGEDTDNSQYYSKMSKSYAMGGTGIDARTEEDTDNAEYYSRLAKSYTMGSFDGSTGTRDDESTENAKTYMETTKSYMNTTNGYMKTTEGYKNDASSSSGTAKSYMDKASEYMGTTEGYMGTTSTYMQATERYMNETEAYMNSVNTSTSNASDSAIQAKSYAVGGTGTRDGEDTDNVSWYYNEMKDMFNGLNIVFIPKGTILFSELATVKETALAGYVYNIRDDFVTTNDFREGAGKTYTSGTNVYYVVDEDGNGKWDCFGGASSPTATLSEVKEYLGI